MSVAGSTRLEIQVDADRGELPLQQQRDPLELGVLAEEEAREAGSGSAIACPGAAGRTGKPGGVEPHPRRVRVVGVPARAAAL